MTAKSSDLRPWLIVGLSFVALSLAFSARAAIGLVMPLIEEELGWSRSFTSGAVAIALFMMAILAPVGGRLVDKQGARAVILIGLGALAIGCFLVAATSHPLAFMIAFGGIAALGFGLVATHVVSAAVEQEFDRNKGLATGIATAGSTGGQFVVVPLIAVLLGSYDWRFAFIALGVGTLLVMLFVFRWFPKGMRINSGSSSTPASEAGLKEDLIAILKMPAFQILFWSYFICGYTTSGVIETHFIPYAAVCGFSPVTSASAYGLLSAVNLGGMILAGWLTDRVSRPLLLGGIYLVRAISFIILANMGADLSTLLFFAVLFGLADYSTVPVTASLVASHIGVRVMGLAFGLISAGHQIGGALGAYLGGIIYDGFSGYSWVWWSSMGLAVVAGLMVFVLNNEPGKRSSEPAIA